MSFFDELGGVFDGFLGVGSGIVDFLINIVSGFVHYVVGLFYVLAGVIQTLTRSVVSFFSHLWSNFFSNIFPRIFHAIRDLANWLETHIRPLIEWLQRAQRYIMRLYTRYVRPIMVMIQRIRQVLTILRALHIQWAQDLDNILAHVQSDINGIFLKITGTINSVIDVLNIVTDPLRLLRHPTLILSMRRSILALIRQLTGLPPGFWIPSPNKSAPTGTGTLPKSFNYLDPAQNPPASYYMSIPSPVPSLAGITTGEEVPDDYGDDVPELDYFNASLWPTSRCHDGLFCFKQAIETSRAKVANG